MVAEKAGKVFGIMYNQRTNPVFQKARDLIAKGELGDLKRVIWIITNWYQPEEPSVPVKPDKPGGGSHLPQAGQLWWPVPILALAGIVFFTVGWVRRKTQENGNE